MNKIEPIECFDINTENRNKFSLKIFLCDKCNFNCTYCYNKYPRTNMELDINKLIEFYKQLKILTNNMIFNVELIGGEPTEHTELDIFIKTLNSIYPFDQFFIYSNFSKPLEYYISLIKYNVEFDFSYHSLKNSINKSFILKAQKLNSYIKTQNINTYIAYSIMIEPENFEYTLYLYKIFKTFEYYNEKPVITVEFLKIDDPNTGKTVYSDKQLLKLNTILNQSSYQACIKYDNNTIKKHTFIELAEDPIFNFKNWKCNAGLQRLYIHSDGNIYECQSAYENEKITNTKNNLGHIDNYENITLNQTLCKYDFCACEWFVYKYKI